jgi:hypothetical protein
LDRFTFDNVKQGGHMSCLISFAWKQYIEPIVCSNILSLCF